MNGFFIPNGATLTGIANLSVQNVDTLSQKVLNLNANVPLSKFFIKNVNWNLGTGRDLYFKGDRIAVETRHSRKPTTIRVFSQTEPARWACFIARH